MTADQVAELLFYHVDYVGKMARNGRIPGHREPGSRGWQFDRDELIAWLRAGPTGR